MTKLLETKMKALLQEQYDRGFKAGKAFANNDVQRSKIKMSFKDQDVDWVGRIIRHNVYAQKGEYEAYREQWNEATELYDTLTKAQQQQVQDMIAQLKKYMGRRRFEADYLNCWRDHLNGRRD